MKSLLSAIGIAGMIAVSSVSYADSIEFKKINYEKLPDVSLAGWNMLDQREINGDLIITFSNDNENRLVTFLYSIKDKKDDGYYLVSKPILFADDLNHNGKFENEEMFEIIYPSTCPINPKGGKLT
jgi:hypothetical protein